MWMPQNISRKFIIGLFPGFLAVFLVAIFFTLYFEYHMLSKKLEQKGGRILELTKIILEKPFWNVDQVQVELILKALLKDEEIIAVFADLAIDETSIKYGVTDSRILEKMKLYQIDIIHSKSGEQTGSVWIYFTDQIAKKKLKFTMYSYGVTMIILMIVTLFLNNFIQKKIIAQPLLNLLDGIRKNFNSKQYFPVAVVSGDEIGSLTKAFNSTMKQVKEHAQNMERLLSERDSLLGEVQNKNKLIQTKNAELQIAHHAAETANRAKSEFLDNTSHELRTPMNAIIGLTISVLKSDLTQQQYENLDKVASSANSLLKKINTILEFSKFDMDQAPTLKEDFFIEDVLNNVCAQSFEKVKEKGLKFDVSVPESLPNAVTGDSHRLEQILLLLIFNAIKFTVKGHVSFRVEHGLAENTKPGDLITLLFYIQDTGVGIPGDMLEKIFLPFTQADGTSTRHHEGMGMGLTLARRSAFQINASIAVESELSKGTTFIVTAKFGRQPSEHERPVQLKQSNFKEDYSQEEDKKPQPLMPLIKENIEIDVGKVKPLLVRLVSLVEFDIGEAADQFTVLREMLGSSEEIESIQSAIDDYDTDEAMAGLMRIAEAHGIAIE